MQGSPLAAQVHETGHGKCSHSQRQLLEFAFRLPPAASVCPHRPSALLVPPSASPPPAKDLHPGSEQGSRLSQHPPLHPRVERGPFCAFLSPECSCLFASSPCLKILVCYPPMACAEPGAEGGSCALRGAEPEQLPPSPRLLLGLAPETTTRNGKARPG